LANEDEEDSMRSASSKSTQAARSGLPLTPAGLLERMERRGVIETVVPLPLDELLACGTPAALEGELSRRIAGDPTLLHLIEWEPLDVEGGSVLLLVRAIAPPDALRARLAAEAGSQDTQDDRDGRGVRPARTA